MFEEDYVSGLFAAQVETAVDHLFHHVTVTYSRFRRAKAKRFSCLEESHVSHNSRNTGVMCQPSGTSQRISTNTQDVIAIHFIAILVDRDQPICVSVEG